MPSTLHSVLSSATKHKELEDVLWDALHHGADLLEVDPRHFLGPNARELLGLHCTPLLLDEVGVRMGDAHDAVEHVLVGVVNLVVVCVPFLAVCGLELGDDPPLPREAGATCTTPLQCP